MPDAVSLLFRCVQSDHKTNEHGRKSYSGLLSALDENGKHLDPQLGFPANGTVHYAVNGDLPAPDLEKGKLYRVTFEEVPEPEPTEPPSDADVSTAAATPEAK